MCFYQCSSKAATRINARTSAVRLLGIPPLTKKSDGQSHLLLPLTSPAGQLWRLAALRQMGLHTLTCTAKPCVTTTRCVLRHVCKTWPWCDLSPGNLSECFARHCFPDPDSFVLMNLIWFLMSWFFSLATSEDMAIETPLLPSYPAVCGEAIHVAGEGSAFPKKKTADEQARWIMWGKFLLMHSPKAIFPLWRCMRMAQSRILNGMKRRKDVKEPVFAQSSVDLHPVARARYCPQS